MGSDFSLKSKGTNWELFLSMTHFHNNLGKVFEEDLFKASSGNAASICLLYPLF